HRPARPATARLALTGIAVALLSPQAGVVLAILTAIFLARRPRALAPGLAGLLAPLAYYLVLSLVSPDWSVGALRSSLVSGPWWTFLVAFGPALGAAAYAVQDRRDPSDAVLWCWLAASALAFLVLRADARAGALEGICLPLAILAVKGWQRLRWPAFVSALALAVAILPGAGYAGASYHDYVNDNYGPFTATRGELAALRALPAGPVLATPYISPIVPIFGGRSTTSPPTPTTPSTTTKTLDYLFDGRLSAAATRAIVTASRATAVLSDCHPGRTLLSPSLAPLGFTTRRFGCAALYVRR
ncbi:MAG TPA: hypothetical protein VGX45_14640, partial [Solirubrobacteraceae bacterium]|nr:hypothetical protein [Solirubrobacteraceae bacterium]